MSVLVIQPDGLCPPGHLSDWLPPFDVCHAYAGDPVPARSDELTGLVVLGGLAGAYDDDQAPWLTQIKALLGDAVRRGVPTLGICLGHQLLAVATGGTVRRRPGGKNSGVIQPVITAAGTADRLLGAVPLRPPAAAWNQDFVAVPPPDAVVLATSDDGELLSYRVGEAAWGVQWHPEATYPIVAGWCEVMRRAGTAGPAVERGLAEVRDAEEEMRAVWQRFGQAFAGLVTAVPQRSEH